MTSTLNEKKYLKSNVMHGTLKMEYDNGFRIIYQYSPLRNIPYSQFWKSTVFN